MSKLAQRDRVIHFLDDIRRRVRPDCKILWFQHQYDREWCGQEEVLIHQANLPAGTGIEVAGQADGATFERQAHEAARRTRQVTWRAGQFFIGRDAFHNYEHNSWASYELGLPDYPLGIFAKIRRWRELSVDGIFDGRGRNHATDLQANSHILRAALLDPGQDAEAACGRLAVRWFGKAAGGKVLAAWKAIERAQAVLSNGWTFPSSSPLSQHFEWFMGQKWTPMPRSVSCIGIYVGLKGAVTAPDWGEFQAQPATGFIYNEGDYAARVERTGQSLLDSRPFLEETVTALRAALALPLPREFPPDDQWHDPLPGEALTPEAYLKNHLPWVETLLHFNKHAGAFFLLKARFLRVDGNEAEYVRQGRGLIADWLRATEELAEHFQRLQSVGMAKPAFCSPEPLRKSAAEVQAWLATWPE